MEVVKIEQQINIENNSTGLNMIESKDIKNLIYTIRGKQVMLDSDVAILYKYSTKNINKAVKRNIERFPGDFCFQLTDKEVENLRFQNGTSSLEFEGQIYDAYSLIIKIIKRAKEKITIIDNYIDDTILDMLAKKNENVKTVILTSNKSNISKIDIQKFNKEYPTLEISTTNKFHDRFIRIDNKELYHCGASLKDLGKKCFAISRMENMDLINKIEK